MFKTFERSVQHELQLYFNMVYSRVKQNSSIDEGKKQAYPILQLFRFTL